MRRGAAAAGRQAPLALVPRRCIPTSAAAQLDRLASGEGFLLGDQDLDVAGAGVRYARERHLALSAP